MIWLCTTLKINRVFALQKVLRLVFDTTHLHIFTMKVLCPLCCPSKTMHFHVDGEVIFCILNGALSHGFIKKMQIGLKQDLTFKG